MLLSVLLENLRVYAALLDAWQLVGLGNRRGVDMKTNNSGRAAVEDDTTDPILVLRAVCEEDYAKKLGKQAKVPIGPSEIGSVFFSSRATRFVDEGG